MVAPNNAWDRLYRAMRPTDPNNLDGPWTMLLTGTVNTIGGGLGGTSMVDNNPFTPGGTSITPAGGYVGGRSIASGNAGAIGLSPSGAVLVHVIAGGAGGGLAQLQVVGTDNSSFANVGWPSGGSPTYNSVPVVVMNQTAAGGGFATVGVYGSVTVLGSVNIGGQPISVVGSAGVTGLGGSIGVTQIGAPWSLTGSVGATQLGAPWSVVGSAGVTVLSGSVGATQLGAPWTVVGSQGVTQLGAPWSVTGSMGVGGLGGSIGAVGLGGSMGVTQIGAPWSVVGSAGITGLGGSIGAVNLGGSVGAFGLGGSYAVYLQNNVQSGGQYMGQVTASVAGVVIVDSRGSLTPTTYAIQASGGTALVASMSAGNRIYVYGVRLLTSATVDVSFVSPSGVYLEGSQRLLPGAGFAENSMLGAPLLVGAAASGSIFLNMSGAAVVGGIIRAWIAP